MLVYFQMNIPINPTLIEDIQQAVECFAQGESWSAFSVQDSTESLRSTFAGLQDVSFNDVRSIYHTIKLPYDLYATLQDEWNDIDIDVDSLMDRPTFELLPQEKREANPLNKQSVKLFVCESAPQIHRGSLELGLRIVQISWSRLFRGVPFGIEQIEISLRYASLEEPQRLPLLLQIVESVSRVKTLAT